MERDVDNWLYRKRISHIYRPLVPIPERLIPSFMIYNSNYQIIYIEVWEKEDTAPYRDMRNKKLEIYAKHHLNLIEIFPADMIDLDSILLEKLHQKEVFVFP